MYRDMSLTPGQRPPAGRQWPRARGEGGGLVGRAFRRPRGGGRRGASCLASGAAHLAGRPLAVYPLAAPLRHSGVPYSQLVIVVKSEITKKFGEEQ